MIKVKSNEQRHCPRCNGTKLNYDSAAPEGNMICYPWECEDCSQKEVKWYELNFIGHNIITPDGDDIEVEQDMIEERGE